MRVDYSAKSGGLIGVFFIIFNMKVGCLFSLESPHRGDSNEYTQYTIFNMNKKNTLNNPKSAAMGFFPLDSRMSSKQPSVFEPLKFYLVTDALISGIVSKVWIQGSLERTFH